MLGMAHKLHETCKSLGELVIWFYHEIIIIIIIIILKDHSYIVQASRSISNLAATTIYVQVLRYSQWKNENG
jgi:hypothetical protein